MDAAYASAQIGHLAADRRPEPHGGERDALRGYLFATPLILVLAAAVILPALYNTGLAFFKYDAMRDAWRFVGARNFATLYRAGRRSGTPSSVTLIWVIGQRLAAARRSAWRSHWR